MSKQTRTKHVNKHNIGYQKGSKHHKQYIQRSKEQGHMIIFIKIQ